jgi:hypothetical protein
VPRSRSPHKVSSEGNNSCVSRHRTVSFSYPDFHAVRFSTELRPDLSAGVGDLQHRRAKNGELAVVLTVLDNLRGNASLYITPDLGEYSRNHRHEEQLTSFFVGSCHSFVKSASVPGIT